MTNKRITEEKDLLNDSICQRIDQNRERQDAATWEGKIWGNKPQQKCCPLEFLKMRSITWQFFSAFYLPGTDLDFALCRKVHKPVFFS